jgi:hypothetical protein
MEDNDLRGHLDGTFQHPWNQPGQIHVRMGRRDRSLRYGEYELFRVLQRWGDLPLPREAQVRSARLVLAIENGPADTVSILVHAVNHDWEPGGGGVLGNNVSPPRDGEVWWNDRAYHANAWGLPGCGYASDLDPAADTPVMPLAEARYVPGASWIEFESAALSRAVESALRDGEALRLLLKVADVHEDWPGTIVRVWSGNVGDSRGSALRPRLELEWQSPSEVWAYEKDVFLEHGRSLVLPLPDGDPTAAWGPARAGPAGRRDPVSVVAATFLLEGQGFRPVIEIREIARGSGVSGLDRGTEGVAPGGNRLANAWRRADLPLRGVRPGLELRVTAATDPIPLGTEFTAVLRDTWVRTAPPEEQRVPWTFTSPTGIRHDLLARYEGENRWSVRFLPDEIGAWTYSWSQTFTPEGFRSGPIQFDVLGGDRDDLRTSLTRFADSLRSGAAERSPEARSSYLVRFLRLERAVLQTETPATFRNGGNDLRDLLRQSRELLGGAVPDSLPMEADAPPKWDRDGEAAEAS